VTPTNTHKTETGNWSITETKYKISKLEQDRDELRVRTSILKPAVLKKTQQLEEIQRGKDAKLLEEKNQLDKVQEEYRIAAEALKDQKAHYEQAQRSCISMNSRQKRYQAERDKKGKEISDMNTKYMTIMRKIADLQCHLLFANPPRTSQTIDLTAAEGPPEPPATPTRDTGTAHAKPKHPVTYLGDARPYRLTLENLLEYRSLEQAKAIKKHLQWTRGTHQSGLRLPPNESPEYILDTQEEYYTELIAGRHRGTIPFYRHTRKDEWNTFVRETHARMKGQKTSEKILLQLGLHKDVARLITSNLKPRTDVEKIIRDSDDRWSNGSGSADVLNYLEAKRRNKFEGYMHKKGVTKTTIKMATTMNAIKCGGPFAHEPDVDGLELQRDQQTVRETPRGKDLLTPRWVPWLLAADGTTLRETLSIKDVVGSDESYDQGLSRAWNDNSPENGPLDSPGTPDQIDLSPRRRSRTPKQGHTPNPRKTTPQSEPPQTGGRSGHTPPRRNRTPTPATGTPKPTTNNTMRTKASAPVSAHLRRSNRKRATVEKTETVTKPTRRRPRTRRQVQKFQESSEERTKKHVEKAKR